MMNGPKNILKVQNKKELQESILHLEMTAEEMQF